MDNRQLKPLAQHNAEIAAEQAELVENALRTGIACPKCGGELYRYTGIVAGDISFDLSLEAMKRPPTYTAECPRCGEFHKIAYLPDAG